MYYAGVALTDSGTNTIHNTVIMPNVRSASFFF